MTITFHWPTIVGLVGMVVVLLAYFLLQARKLHGNGVVYLLMNALGSAAIIVSLIYEFNLASMVLEIAWLAISIYGLVRGRRGPSLPG
ncbi:MAG: CBU_0592 family membrane protein [Rhodanobacteraceae bacterium]